MRNFNLLFLNFNSKQWNTSIAEHLSLFCTPAPWGIEVKNNPDLINKKKKKNLSNISK